MSISSANPRRLAVAAGYGALAIGLPYGVDAYASPAWALMAACVCGLGFAGYRLPAESVEGTEPVLIWRVTHRTTAPAIGGPAATGFRPASSDSPEALALLEGRLRAAFAFSAHAA